MATATGTQARPRARGRSRLYLAAGLAGVAIGIVGFAKTFFTPLIGGTFSAPPLIYVHALFLFGWLGFFLSQSLLVHRRRLPLHRQAGWAGLGLAVGVVASTLAVGVLASRRTAAGGAAEIANAELLVIQLEMSIFAALVGAAVWKRRQPEVHKRLMLLALIGSLGPAWFRFRHYFPEIGNPVFVYSLLIADSLILIAAAWDYRRTGKVHWVYPIVGGAMVAVHLIEVFCFETAAFGAVAAMVAAPLI